MFKVIPSGEIHVVVLVVIFAAAAATVYYLCLFCHLFTIAVDFFGPCYDSFIILCFILSLLL